MEKLTYVNKFYMDKEKDVVVELYRGKLPDELTYIIRTPNHKSGNLISNLAKISGLEYERDPENGLKIIKGIINTIVYLENLVKEKKEGLIKKLFK